MKIPFVTEIVKKVAPEIGASVLVEPEYGFVGRVSFQNGGWTFFRDTQFDINAQGATEIAKDKAYAGFFLQRLGYKTPEGRTFFSDELNLKVKREIDAGLGYAHELGFPVIVKPNNLGQGALVAKVHNETEYYPVARKILQVCPVMLVQRFHAGRDYRVVVLDSDAVIAYERTALYVIGDGRSCINELLEQKILERRAGYTVLDKNDFRITMKLASQGISFSDVPEKEKRIFLLDNANLSAGGEATDVANAIHDDFRSLAVNVTRDMGLRFCGVDIIAEDITRSLEEQRGGYVVVEINGAPGLDNYAAMGCEQRERVENLYRSILQKIEKGLDHIAVECDEQHSPQTTRESVRRGSAVES